MTIIEQPYHADASTGLSHFLNWPYPALLDSCRSEQAEHGRFDILSAAPSCILTTDGDQTLRKTADGSKKLAGDIFTHIQTELQRYQIDRTAYPAEWPFTVGAIGYLGYSLGLNLEAIPAKTHADVGLPVVQIGFYDWSLITDHQEQRTWLVSHWPADHAILQRVQRALRAAPMSIPPFQLSSDFVSNMDFNAYRDAFQHIQWHLTQGDCYQINLCQRFRADYTGHPFNAYRALRQANPAAFAGYLQSPSGAVLCLSPEQFLQIKNNLVTTQPIKGTRPRYSDASQDLRSAEALVSSAKDQAENVMIVDLLRNDLGRVSKAGSVDVSELCALHSFSNVHHLVSTIQSTLQADYTSLDALRACFPGGSITGAPKIRVMQIINELEPHERSVYCGSLLCIDASGDLSSNIAIRTVLCNDKTAYVYGGGGIVCDSTVDDEYAESLIKIKRLLDTMRQQ